VTLSLIEVLVVICLLERRLVQIDALLGFFVGEILLGALFFLNAFCELEFLAKLLLGEPVVTFKSRLVGINGKIHLGLIRDFMVDLLEAVENCGSILGFFWLPDVGVLQVAKHSIDEVLLCGKCLTYKVSVIDDAVVVEKEIV